MLDLAEVKNGVQKNCDLVDAQYAQNYGLCVYLLRMREYYRWSNNIPLYSDLENDKVHTWIADIEEHWDKILGQPFKGFVINRKAFEPFETLEINNSLLPHGYVYSGGYGPAKIPLFFLAKLDTREHQKGFDIIISSEELARGMFGSPAMLLGKTIFVRREALRYMLVAKFDEWLFQKRDNTMKKALSYYDLESNFDAALERMTDKEIEVLILHEIGEGLAAEAFGENWEKMLADFAYSRTEIIIRAIRDLAADCLSTLPALIFEERSSSLHFYFANFSDMRKQLAPNIYEAYKQWSESSDLIPLATVVEKGKSFWIDIGNEILAMYLSEGKAADSRINQLVGSLVV